MGVCLSKAELAEITDCKRRAEQMRWLTENGWCFTLSAKGDVKVLRAEAEAKMMSEPPRAAYRAMGEPDLEAI